MKSVPGTRTRPRGSPSTRRGGGAKNHIAIENQILKKSLSAAPREKAQADEDSVRAYYGKLGKVPLLTREGEVVLARRIEDADTQIVRALVHAPAAVVELAAIAAELGAGTLRARDVTRNPAEEEEDEAAARDRLVCCSRTCASSKGSAAPGPPSVASGVSGVTGRCGKRGPGPRRHSRRCVSRGRSSCASSPPYGRA